MGANELSAQLWRQREILELLLFKYDEEQLLLAAGRTRWIPQATREIEKVVERLQDASVSLSVALVELAGEWGLPNTAILREVVAAAPDEMWRGIFTDHLGAIVELITEIRATRNGNDRLVRVALESLRGATEGAPAAGTYSADGRPDHTIPIARLIDETL